MKLATDDQRKFLIPALSEADIAAFAAVGDDPNTAWLRDCVALDSQQFVKTGAALDTNWPLARSPFPMESSLPGIFAVGDVRAGSVKRVASSLAQHLRSSVETREAAVLWSRRNDLGAITTFSEAGRSVVRLAFDQSFTAVMILSSAMALSACVMGFLLQRRSVRQANAS